MIPWNDLSPDLQQASLERPLLDEIEDLEFQVATILGEVKRSGDLALKTYTRRFDGVDLDTPGVSMEKVRSAAENLDPVVRRAIDEAYEQIRAFHLAQKQSDTSVETIQGVTCTLRIRPQDSVGLYVPGGVTPLPSTALMLAIPAQLAGCPEIVMVTPPGRDGEVSDEILYIAGKCGIESVYKVGGAQAIAALAFGTESVPAVDKIFGPGNRYVTTAKQLIAQDGTCAIDMPAGPSELLVIADKKAKPDFVAIDLLSQAEHGPDSQVVLVSDSETIIKQVTLEVSRLTPALERKLVIAKALTHARYILVDSIAEAVDLSNRYAPEHLILQVESPRRWLDKIKHAGSIFLGPWTPESAGDYASGTNHVLPTYGAARYTSSLGLADFQKRSTVQELSQEGLRSLGSTIMTLAATEGLTAHEQAVALRLKELGV